MDVQAEVERIFDLAQDLQLGTVQKLQFFLFVKKEEQKFVNA